MSGIVVVGNQWGDEGKGKIVDYLAERADGVVRFNGGCGAGHTVVVGNDVYKFHLIPCGVLHGKKLFLGNGVVIAPDVLFEEIEPLEKKGIEPKLMISGRAHVTFDFHRLIDGLEEGSRDKMIGTTKRGIGPTYTDKAARFGLRVVDLLNKDVLKRKLGRLVEMKQKIIRHVYGSDVVLDKEKTLQKYLEYGEKMRKYVGDVSAEVNSMLDSGKTVVFEGAQGALLDIDHGIYPNVTSSNTIAGSACTGTGVGPKRIDEIIGIVKAYSTRVGSSGPFPTRLGTKEQMGQEKKEDGLTEDDVKKAMSGDEYHIGKYLRKRGKEYGATTGRPRDTGWFDVVPVRFAARINGITSMAVTKLDVLDGLDPVKIAVKYRHGNKIITNIPEDMEVYEKCEPVYEEQKGWPCISQKEWMDIAKKGYDGLPEEVKTYLKRIEELVGCPIKLISVGPEREATIWVM